MTPANELQQKPQPLPRAPRQPFAKLPDWLLQFATDISEESEPQPSITTPKARLTQLAVTMTKRYRATSVADMVGIFSPNGTNQWLDVPIANFHVLPIVNPQVRANMSASVAARVRLKFEPATTDPNKKGASVVAESVARYVDEELWNEQCEALLSERAQLSGGVLVRSFHNEDKGSETLSVREWGETEMTNPGEYACASCQAGGPYLGEVQDEGNGWMTGKCPECGETADIMRAPEPVKLEAPTGSREVKHGDNDHEILTIFQMRIDERNTKGGDLERAEFFEVARLRPTYELQEEYPQHQWDTPKEWSYGLKWERALETGMDANYNWREDDKKTNLHEERCIYLRPRRYRHYKAPAAYELRDADGNVQFRIEAGERLIDVRPNGFYFKICDDKLLSISKPEEGDFRKEYVFIQWMPDPFSFWPLPNIVLLPLQDNANTQFTLWMQHLERNSIINLAYDSKAFESEDFETELVPTRSNFNLEARDSIDSHVTVLKTPELREPMSGLNFILSILPLVGGMQPAALGSPSPNEPYAAQLLQRQSSLGLLTPYNQSKAQGKVNWVKQQLKIAQDKWDPARFEHIRTRFGEEWKDEDIEAFLNCDLSNDIKISYIEGSEIPTSLIERQIKLENFLTKIAEIAQIAPQFITPEFVKDVVSQLAAMSDVEIDVANTEADRRLANARYQKIKSLCQNAGQAAQGGIVNPALVQEVQESPHFHVMSNVENHETHIEFYGDHLRALAAADHPDLNLITCLGLMISKHEEAAGEEEKKKGLPQMKIAESMAYKDLPEDVKRQMEQAAGFQPSQLPPATEGDTSPDPSVEAAMEAQAAEKEALMQAQEHAHQEDQAQVEGDRQMMEAEAQREHDAQQAEEDRQHELKKQANEHAHIEKVAKITASAKGRSNSKGKETA